MAKKQRLFKMTADDFVFKPTRGTGAGGQKKNKTYSAIQCFHPPSGAMGYAEDSRDQSKNRGLAFKRCYDTKEFQAWFRMKKDAANGNIDITEIDEDGKAFTRKLSHEEIK
jgi:protein subunit release factor B